MRRRFLLFLLALCLTGVVPARALPAPPVATSRQSTIVCFGDSITAGYGLDPSRAYPSYLQDDLNARGFHYRVVNEGVSGNTTKDALDRLPDVLALHPAIVIVELGGNDGLRGIPPDITRENLATIVSRILAAGSKVLLAGITLPPNYGADYIHEFDLTYHLVADRYHVPLLPMLYIHVYDVPGAIQQDGIHPTAKGSELVARNFLSILLPMLHK
jgi:acyl-CoA thioesterase I